MPTRFEHPKKVEKIQLVALNAPWRDALALGTRCLFPKHHCEPGEKMRGFYFIARGRVRLTYTSLSGKEKCILYMGKDCLFNEVPALRQCRPVPLAASFFCLEEVEAWRFKADLLADEAFVARYPGLIINLLHSMARKSQLLFAQVSGNTSANSMGQLCTILLEVHENRSLQLSQGEVAGLLGLHLTTVARLIRSLREQGIVGRFTKNCLEVLDAAALRALATDQGA